MISFIETTKMTDRPVIATCVLGTSSRLRGAGLSLGLPGGVEPRVRETEAPAVAALAAANAYAFAATAGAGSRTMQQHHMWAHRGLEPWSYRT